MSPSAGWNGQDLIGLIGCTLPDRGINSPEAVRGSHFGVCGSTARCISIVGTAAGSYFLLTTGPRLSFGAASFLLNKYAIVS